MQSEQQQIDAGSLQNFAARTSTMLANVGHDDTDSVVVDTMRAFAELIGLQRCHLCRLHRRRPVRISMEHEWRREGLADLADQFRHLPVELFPWLHGLLVNNQVARVAGVDSLPARARTLTLLLSSRGIDCYLAVPLRIEGRLWGFVGCVPDDADLLDNSDLQSAVRLTGEMLAMALRRKESARSLRRSRRHWRNLAESTYDFVAIVDDQGRIQSLKRNVAGLGIERFVGEPIYDFVHPQYRREMQLAIEAVLASDEHKTFEHEAAGPGGRFVWYRTTVSPVDKRSRVRGVSLLSTSIQDQKEAEERVRELSEELESASRVNLMGMVASQISHELGQPLQVISSNADDCQTVLGQSDPDANELRELLSEISTATETARDIIDRVRDFVRNRSMELGWVDVDSIVDKAVRLIEPSLRRHNVELVRDVAAGLPQVCVDGVQITTVLLNLMVNGIQAMSSSRLGQGRLTVTARMKNEHFVEISVADRGPGVPPEQHDKLFNRFFTTRRDGLGTGLALARDVVQAHEGQIWLDPATKTGAVFRFTLPRGDGIGTDTTEMPLMRQGR